MKTTFTHEQMMTIIERATVERNEALGKIITTSVRSTLDFLATVAETFLLALPAALLPKARTTAR